MRLFYIEHSGKFLNRPAAKLFNSHKYLFVPLTNESLIYKNIFKLEICKNDWYKSLLEESLSVIL